METELKDFKKGLFIVKMKEKVLPKPSQIEEHIAGFELEKVEVTLVGAGGDDGSSFEARTSKTKVGLQYPKTKDSPDLVKKVAGKPEVKVAGLLKEVKTDDKKTKLVIEVASAEPVEPKKK